MKKVVVVSASLSESSSTDQLGRKIAEEVVEALGGSEQAELTIVSLRVLAHAIVDAMLAGYAKPELEEAFEVVEQADALVAVTPAYNASMSGLFKSFFDVLPQEVMAGKPVVIGATGGTPRHSLVTEHALRPMFSYLRARVAPTAIFAATEDWGAHAKDSDGSGGVAVSPRTKRAAKELAMIVAMQAGEAPFADSDSPEGSEQLGDTGANGGAAGAGAFARISAAERPSSARPRNSDLAKASASELLEMEPEDLYSGFTSFEDLLGESKE